MIKVTKWDSADYLTSPRAIAAYLDAAFTDGDPKVIAKALGNVARAKGIAQIAESAGVTKSGLYKALSEDGDPRLSTLVGALRAMGFELKLKKAA
jgi:probable addiction module antidote protein